MGVHIAAWRLVVRVVVEIVGVTRVRRRRPLAQLIYFQNGILLVIRRVHAILVPMVLGVRGVVVLSLAEVVDAQREFVVMALAERQLLLIHAYN